jgi:hypothetical protein
MIKGDPPRLDFGKGLLIPMNGSIFKTLWEGEDRWITYADALATQQVRAMGQRRGRRRRHDEVYAVDPGLRAGPP